MDFIYIKFTQVEFAHPMPLDIIQLFIVLKLRLLSSMSTV